MILRALWVAIGLHRQPEIPLEGPRESYYAFRYFATMKHEGTEEKNHARVDNRTLFQRLDLPRRSFGD
jgi:hypothetical protein